MKTIAVKNTRTAVQTMLFLLLFFVSSANCFSQYNVTEIITDYGGYWKSAAASVNPVKPDNSHNLLSFSFNGTRYSTGVNDALLTSHGESFNAGDYRALPVSVVSGAVTSNTKIGLGYMYDGVANGPSTPAPQNNIPNYLTDGIKGLNLGTCVANLPAGTMNFPVSNILASAIGDAIPDVVITQIADPSGSQDRYQFTDINGAVVGNYVDIALTNISVTGNWTADFYEASQNPMTLAGGYTKTDRPIRLWATDLSAFGINSSNFSSVAYFKIILSGNSDVAFVAYNASAINLINYVLPINLGGFSAQPVNNQVQVKWETNSETNSEAFTIERSTDGAVFTAIGKVNASANTAATVYYAFTDKNPATATSYYRLKMVDKDGHFEYSKTITVSRQPAASAGVSCYPNPATSYIVVNHLLAGSNEQFQIVNLQGNVVLQKKITASTFQTRLELTNLVKGTYQLIWTNGAAVSANTIVKL